MAQKSRTPQGVRGLKYLQQRTAMHDERRTPQGVRGLKCLFPCHGRRNTSVAPRKGCVD